MAYTTVSRDLAAKYPSLKDKIGQTITSAELQAAKANSENAKPEAPASAPRAPRATAAKKVAKKTAKKVSKKASK